MNREILRPVALIAVLAIIGSAVYLAMKPASETPAIGENEPVVPSVGLYDSAAHGIAFTYPDSYVLTEREVGTAERSHYAITLTDKVATMNIPENGEGPTAITIEIFGNGIDKLPVETWIKNTSASNFKIALDHKLATSTVSGVNAYSYTWDGLYRGDTTVFAHKDDILMTTVTYMDSTDTIRDDFRALLGTLILR